MFHSETFSDRKPIGTTGGTLLGSLLLVAGLSLALPALATAGTMQDSMQKHDGAMHTETMPAGNGMMKQNADKKMDKSMAKDDGMKMKMQSMDKDKTMKDGMNHQNH